MPLFPKQANYETHHGNDNKAAFCEAAFFMDHGHPALCLCTRCLAISSFGD